MTRSAGFIIVNADLTKVLLGKTFTRPKCKDHWTTFKGGVEDGEQLIDTAIRELKEESGIDIAGNRILQDSISTGVVHSYTVRDKHVSLYMLVDKAGALNDYQFKCNSFYEEGKPEIESFRWFGLDEADEKVFPSQKGMIQFLKTLRECHAAK